MLYHCMKMKYDGLRITTQFRYQFQPKFDRERRGATKLKGVKDPGSTLGIRNSDYVGINCLPLPPLLPQVL